MSLATETIRSVTIDLQSRRQGGRHARHHLAGKATIGPHALRIVCPMLGPVHARLVAAALGDAFRKHGVTTPQRAAAAVAQMAHESSQFRFPRELWGPTPDQMRYAHILGNNGIEDAFRYRGGGYIQVTGKSNFQEAAHATGLPLAEHPDLLGHPENAAMVSCWWWETHGCNELADHGDFLALTKRINGGTNGLASRRAYWVVAKRVARWLVPRNA